MRRDNLPVEDRQLMHRPMPPQARAIIAEVARERGVTPEAITRAGRKQKLFRARIEAAKRLAERKYTSPQIGRMLGCDHTMILYYLGRLKKKPSPEKWRKPKIKTLWVAPPPPKPKRRVYYLIPYAGVDKFDYKPVRRQPLYEERV